MSLADCLMVRGRLLPAAAGLALMAGVLAAPPAQAGYFGHYGDRHLDNQSRAWCAYYSGISSSIECSYDTYAQCRATISGVGGFCAANPNYVAVMEERPDRRRTHHRRYEPR